MGQLPQWSPVEPDQRAFTVENDELKCESGGAGTLYSIFKSLFPTSRLAAGA